MKSTSLIAFSAILACLAVSSLVEAQGKTCNLKEFDMCITNFYYDQKGVPSNEKHLRKTCSSTRTLSKCLGTYFHRCASPAFRETLMILVDSILNPFLETCAKPTGDEKRNEIFKYSKCLNANSKKIATCAESNKEMIFYVLEASYEQRVPIVCCNAKVIAECTSKKTTELCDKHHSDFQESYYKGGEILRELCAHYEPHGETCKGFMVPPGYKSTEDPKSPLSRMINAFF